jgi:hypothetical protein
MIGQFTAREIIKGSPMSDERVYQLTPRASRRKKRAKRNHEKGGGT